MSVEKSRDIDIGLAGEIECAQKARIIEQGLCDWHWCLEPPFKIIS